MSIEQLPVPHPQFQDRQGKDWYVWKETAVRPFVADMYSDLKRLTDAETAADYWGLRAMLDGGLVSSHDLTIPWSRGCAPIRDSMTPAGHLIREQVNTLLHFALRPHYDEVDR